MPAHFNPCRCCGTFTRRGFLAASALVAPLPGAQSPAPGPRSDPRPPARLPLVVQPVLLYETPRRVEARSWRPWGGVLTEEAAAAERARIADELASLRPSFPLTLLPLLSVKSLEQARALSQAPPHDVVLVYGAAGSVRLLETIAASPARMLLFVRHRSGPAYLWYEIAHCRFLRKTVDEFGQPGMDVDDVVVDSLADVLWRFQALAALKNAMGKRIVAVGGASGWGAGGRQAAEGAREVWKFDIQPVPYSELGERIRRARADAALVARARSAAADYLAQPGVSLETGRAFVDNAFVLVEVLRGLVAEHQTDALTINECMTTVMPLAETTACLPLSLLNDAGYMAFCESDFVVIPSGILLRYVANRPVFLNDPTYPHHGVVTLAHCTAPRRMDGLRAEPVRILTHFESDYGAAPKVEMTRGQEVTVLNPDFSGRNWVGFEGEIAENPFLAICRSQIDVNIRGDAARLLREMKGFHWMACYGRHLRETAYALAKSGIRLTCV